MYLFGLSLVLLPIWIINLAVKILMVCVVVGSISIPIATILCFAFVRWGRSWSSGFKRAIALILAAPVLFLLFIGLKNAPDAAWCEVTRGTIHAGHSCEVLESSWFSWIYLPGLTRNTKAGTPEQEEMIRQNLPN